jgi:hypothetical protein
VPFVTIPASNLEKNRSVLTSLQATRVGAVLVDIPTMCKLVEFAIANRNILILAVLAAA